MDLGKHLIDFFELYGTLFDYDKTGISIRTGNFSKESHGWEGHDSRNVFELSLALENPQDPQINLGMACYEFYFVKCAFKEAYNTLTSNNI